MGFAALVRFNRRPATRSVHHHGRQCRGGRSGLLSKPSARSCWPNVQAGLDSIMTSFSADYCQSGQMHGAVELASKPRHGLGDNEALSGMYAMRHLQSHSRCIKYASEGGR